ncbi:hypothetical protein [Nocardioides sp. B-3]|uniref:hypothetical protein n=1 Tax=Nocardioides sp. B-3 TaxID=2895565 RepID=UPI00215278A2|nr:hypothetical protein [Nocardioides sp. B-3]UUZ61462.1 hypothetical protein LP418_13365 [Nocardioides sp. B-3]
MTVPATVLSAGLGVAVLNGMVGAAFASADSFKLTSPSLSATDLSVRPGFAGPATTAGSKSSAVAAVSGASANGLGMAVTKNIPVVGDVSVAFCPGGTNFVLGDTLLNAAELSANGAGTKIGGAIVVGATQSGASSLAGWSDGDTGYDTAGNGSGFALTANGDATNQTVMNDLSATAYRADLPGGLSGLTTLAIKTAKSATAPTC